jgi:hypothetical protein
LVPGGRWPAFRAVKILFGIKAAVPAAAIDVMSLPTDEFVIAPRPRGAMIAMRGRL